MAKEKTGFFFDIKPLDYLLDKDLALDSFIKYQLDRTQSMFEYKNLPETMPQEMVEVMLQRYGHVFVTKEDGGLYAFTGGMGGEPDVYGRPTIYTVANPALKLSKNYEIGKDGVLIANDTMMWGMIPMLSKYGTLLLENEISLRTIIIYLRIVAVISASDDKTKASADRFMEKIIAGDLSVIGESPFFDGVKVQSLSTTTASYIQQFIELEQYLKGTLYNELGLNANYNMKRESLTKNETALNEDFLMPLVDNMLANRKRGWDAVNDMFGTDISVEFGSTWKKRATLDVIEMEKAVKEVQQMETSESSQLNEETDQIAGETSDTADASVVAEENVESLSATSVEGSADDDIDSTEGAASDEPAEGSTDETPESETDEDAGEQESETDDKKENPESDTEDDEEKKEEK